MKKAYTIFFILALIYFGYIIFNNKPVTDVPGVCGTSEANWVEEHNECENISKPLCEQYNGEFYECESACRHTKDEVCTEQCVEVCKFKKE